jgi:hypothetical protein
MRIEIAEMGCAYIGGCSRVRMAHEVMATVNHFPVASSRNGIQVRFRRL